jgi:hypothetical protein
MVCGNQCVKMGKMGEGMTPSCNVLQNIYLAAFPLVASTLISSSSLSEK